MARRQITVMTDDVTGKEGEDITTVIIVDDNVAYAVDMSAETRAAYAKLLAPYLRVGRRVGRAPGNVLRPAFGAAPSARAQKTPSMSSAQQNKAIREWWGKNAARGGLPAPTGRGRIPEQVLKAFQLHAGRPIVPGVTAATKEQPVNPAPAATFSAAPAKTAPVAKAPPKDFPDKGRGVAPRRQGPVVAKPVTKRAGRKAAAS